MTKGCYFDYMQLHKFYFQGMMRPLLQIKVWKFFMSQIGNHAFMQKFVELLNSASPKLAVELIAPDAVFNSVITGREHTGQAMWWPPVSIFRERTWVSFRESSPAARR